MKHLLVAVLLALVACGPNGKGNKPAPKGPTVAVTVRNVDKHFPVDVDVWSMKGTPVWKYASSLTVLPGESKTVFLSGPPDRLAVIQMPGHFPQHTRARPIDYQTSITVEVQH